MEPFINNRSKGHGSAQGTPSPSSFHERFKHLSEALRQYGGNLNAIGKEICSTNVRNLTSDGFDRLDCLLRQYMDAIKRYQSVLEESDQLLHDLDAWLTKRGI